MSYALSSNFTTNEIREIDVKQKKTTILFIAYVWDQSPTHSAIHRFSSIEQNYPRIPQTFEEKVDKNKIKLNKARFQKFNNLAIRLNSKSMTLAETVLELRGVNIYIEILASIGFLIFVN